MVGGTKGYCVFRTAHPNAEVFSLAIATPQGVQVAQVRVGFDGENAFEVAASLRALAEWCERYGMTDDEIDVYAAEVAAREVPRERQS